MRRLLTWVVVTLGIAALVGWLRGRRKPAEVSAPAPAGEDPADELRRKLAESRETDSAPAQETAVEERRSEVHEQARSALEDMRSGDES